MKEVIFFPIKTGLLVIGTRVHCASTCIVLLNYKYILPKECINSTRFVGLEVSAVQIRSNEFYQELLHQTLSTLPWKITKLCSVLICCNNIILWQTIRVHRFTHHGFHCSWKNCCGNSHASQYRSFSDLLLFT